MDANLSVPEPGHGRVGSSVGHLDLKDDQDQVEKSVSKLDLHERPDVVSSIMSTSDNCQISSLQYHEEVRGDDCEPVALEVPSDPSLLQRPRIPGSALQSSGIAAPPCGVEKRDVNKRLTSRASETGDIKSLNAGAGINGINDGRAPKGRIGRGRGRVKALPKYSKDVNCVGSEELQSMNSTQQMGINNPPSYALHSSPVNKPHAGKTNPGDHVDVLKRAAESEAAHQKRTVMYEGDSKIMEPLERMLDDIYNSLQPTEDDYRRRQLVIERLNDLVRSLDSCQGVEVVPFGSFESNFYTACGDLDLSLEFPVDQDVSPTFTKSKKVKVLKSVERALGRSGVARRIQLIAHARVPLLMFVDSELKISCDISVDNGSALFKSRVLRWITDMDPRCRKLIFMIKCWAKAQCINDPKLGTLNSYALSLLVVFHLQTRSPPILPPFKTLLGEHTSMPVAGKLNKDAQLQQMQECYGRIQALVSEGFGQDNKCSIGQLFLSFFGQFASVKSLWVNGLAVSPFWGEWGDSTTTNPAWNRKQYAMRVEDPFDRMDNCARSIQDAGLPIICNSFAAAFESLLQPPDWDQLLSLRQLLFCWPPGTARPDAYVRQSLVPNPVWRSKPEIRAEKKGKEQVKVPKKYRIADKTATRKLKEHCSSKNSSDDLPSGLLPMLEGETGSFLLKEREAFQGPSPIHVLDTVGLGARVSDTSQVTDIPQQEGGLVIMEALGLGSQAIMNPEAGVQDFTEEQCSVHLTRRGKTLNKTCKKMGPEQWAVSAMQYAQSQDRQPGPDNSGGAGTATSCIDNEPSESIKFPGKKQQIKSARPLKSPSAGVPPGSYECGHSSGTQRIQRSTKASERTGQENIGEESEASFLPSAESSQIQPSIQSNELGNQPQHGLQTSSKHSSLDDESYIPPRKPRRRPRRYNKRQSNAGVNHGSSRDVDPGFVNHANNDAVTGRQGILTPELFVGGPSTQRDFPT
ncbi:uncharacterized protein [Physcomitrium patens]|uniref:Poly(A) RNA polymerase mitochondrial-like central palm domain-containing protein n=1 Tax=Physcomitrium patens TaxID=3218 RepID=A0A2K1K4F4_PHYPA|nr:uncharacterized protein LOC112286559 isoform X1 [Physcomitrium patens]PNR48657.1 hypothetical protein PHYPA_013134 [Physcomitrium patens]|eukprot:XP_024384294.1 uncharacterized protein LOC112286559 isoform X1 [Physcomitrella patens]